MESSKNAIPAEARTATVDKEGGKSETNSDKKRDKKASSKKSHKSHSESENSKSATAISS